jgi:Spy/CpxP family protein refolding chaperone
MEETTMKVKSTIFVTALLVVFAASGLFAQRGPANPGGERMMRFLGLSAEQQAQWTVIHDEMKAKVEPLREQRQVNRAEIAGELQQASPNAFRIGELVIANHGLGLQAKAFREETHARIMAMLTPEQQEKFQQMIQRQRGRRGGFGLGDGAGFGGDCLGNGPGAGPSDGTQRGGRRGPGKP